MLYGCTDATSAEDNENSSSIHPYTATINILGTKEPNKSGEIFQKETPPNGMVFIPGGYIHLGSEQGYENEKPRVWASVQSFFMDETEVTVAAFREFINATGYKTEAEKFGNSGVFYNDENNWWRMKDGANWEYPQGGDQPKAKDDHPVTQVSWNDAAAYASWAGKRLPREIEWEHAARNANNSEARYSWGEDAKENGKWKLNFFQGNFPKENINEDGFVYTAPVGSFGKSILGLADMSGNVWEWCNDDKISYVDLASGNFSNANKLEKVMRGGSFLCETTVCHGYRVSSRSFSTPETSLMHIGFRCVKDIK
jgi:formylglycine-generating enzyme